MFDMQAAVDICCTCRSLRFEWSNSEV